MWSGRIPMRTYSMKKITCLVLSAVFAPLLMLGVVYAQTSSTNLNLKVSVPAEFSYWTTAEPVRLTFTEADVIAGVKLYPAGTSLTVDTNTTNGYVLSVQAMNYGGYSHITFQVQGVSTVYQVTPGGLVEVHIPYTGANPTVHTISYTVHIAAGTAPGAFAWPVVVSAHPL